MKTFKRIALMSVMVLGVCAASATAASAAVSGGAVTMDAGSTTLTINGGGPSVTCSDSEIRGTADGDNTVDDATLYFGGSCTALGFYPVGVSCTASPLTANPTGIGTATGYISLSANECTVTISFLVSSCVVSVPSAATQVDGTITNATSSPDDAGVITVNVANETSALPFTASGGLCGTLGIPASGTSTFAPTSGAANLVYTETGGGLDLDVRP